MHGDRNRWVRSSKSAARRCVSISTARCSRSIGGATTREREAPIEPRVWIGEDEGQTALIIDGVVQSVYVDGDVPLGPGYWPLMLPEVRPRTALILGMGGGTIAHLLMRRFGPLPILGVEIDPRVIDLGRSAFGLDRPNIEIIEGDAANFVMDSDMRFDYVAVDLFAHGVIPPLIFQKPFLRALRELLPPSGLAAINFFRDRRTAERERRFNAVFPRVTLETSSKNVVARCRAR